MIEAGIYHKLKVGRITDHGLYLCDDEGSEVLLPNRYVSLENRVGDELAVFVYHDSEDRLVASTETPLVTVGEVAVLRVVDKTIHGAFLDWGLSAKDLFLPNRNMQGYIDPGHSYAVYVYRDSITGRAVATMNLRSFINNDDLEFRRGDEVGIIVTQRMEPGYRVVVNNRHFGMIYSNQLFGRKIAVGDSMKAYVRKITEDNRLDLSLQREGYDEVKDSADKLLDLVKANGGTLALSDSSSPEEIARVASMSKKVFKRSVGYLLKRGRIEMTANGITAKKENG